MYYLQHYGLDAPPFSITPDPRFVFLGERHRDALAHLRYGIEQGGGGGFVQLTGEVGTGKTTLSRLLLEQLPANVRAALILNPRLQPVELLESICEELRIDIEAVRGNGKGLVDALNRWLLQAYADDLKVVVLIDEAQNLSADALEQVRLLTNLETDTQKLLQIVLLGQPELRQKLARPELRQLAQRITARYHLMPLDAAETTSYLHHRWRVGGGQRFPFDAGAVRALHRHAGGVPRLLNVLAERALLAGYARDAAVIDRKLVNLAASELLPARARMGKWPLLAAGALGLLAVTGFMLWPRPADAPASTPVAGASTGNTQAQAAEQPSDTSPAAAAQPIDNSEAIARRIAVAGASPLPAWQALLQAWQLPADSIRVETSGACIADVGSPLHCRSGQTTLERLLALQRPALLRLHGGGGQAWALLLGADGRSARLQLAGQTLDVPRGILQQHWNGQYASLWQTDAALATQADTNTWVRQRLSAQPGSAPVAPGPRALAEAVRSFQRAHGLDADGVAGADTLMALAADLPGPRLLRVLE